MKRHENSCTMNTSKKSLELKPSSKGSYVYDGSYLNVQTTTAEGKIMAWNKQRLPGGWKYLARQSV
jgi:hypothetical protein